ncbi:uncharacterized protein K444DRAFT_629029 [Hyaloscypha bicolor E]|uniref:Uncharacterized protein n=1 Tax=Hyaloscypha bicolor E TaxID=1095630 RepID=A0A2J6TDE3_9HELO|nr:uncharacterized protein K444DRAFT_629029 [Hyaloscypha bicolor E]PMD61013.1 hypothetical protein K444DRAFT_629029 [Hyaloscypha bicolor E]
MKRPVSVADAVLGVNTESEKINVGVSVTSTFILLNTVVSSSCVVTELTTVEVAAAAPAVLESVSTDVTTTKELVVKTEVVNWIEVNVAAVVTDTGTAGVIGAIDVVTDSGAAVSAGHTPAFTTPN